MIPIRIPKSFKTELHTGVVANAAPALAADLIVQKAAKGGLVWIIVRDAPALERWADGLDFFQKSGNSASARPIETLVFPEIPDLEEGDPRRFEAECDRLTVLAALGAPRAKDTVLAICSTATALVQPVPEPNRLMQGEVRLKKGQTQPFRELVRRFSEELGYDNEAVCETPGQFSVRGGIIDIYPLNATAPVRIDFFGDQIESLRAFDPTSQRSVSDLEELAIVPAPSCIQGKDGRSQSLPCDHLPHTGILWIVEEPQQLSAVFTEIFQKPENISFPKPNLETVLQRRAHTGDCWIGIMEFDESPELFAGAEERIAHCTETLALYRPFTAVESLGVDRLEADTRARADFLRAMAKFAKAGESVQFAVSTQGEAERLSEILADISEWENLPRNIAVTQSGVAGFRQADPQKRRILVTDTEIFGRFRRQSASALRRPRKLPQRSRVDQLLDFSELADGDFLVHLAHGICLYRGLRKIETPNGQQEVITLEFDEGAILHLPLHESHLLSRYVGLAKTTPKLGKLGSNGWEKTRRAAELATLDYAAELLSMQAKRTTQPGYAFAEDQPWQNEMEAAFPFRETPDQLRAIEEVKADMESTRPMDRLICGDVGFGKTEVAVRAAFKAVMSGKQVAVLAPTTVLAQQHYHTFRERFAGFPVVVEMISRFRSSTQQKQILSQLKQGKIDILIGTHRLLSGASHFRDLGLLIVDEEHRFGVRQKERLKRLRENLDILTMSATPIPRTLYFALMGVRDLSVIETPPTDRLPIQTIVKSYSPELVKEAIRYETGRDGQVFYLHNRVQTIEQVADRLREAMPDLRIGVGHGQMDAEALEKLMTQFVAGEYDVLVCTTIIESGLDIPNCNTLIIEGADRFGLAQLYQLRGRVGRFNRQAYAYLLLHRHAALLDQARKRLSAMRQYNQLGSGFRIAMRDLELRGAGNLLGAKQSGHIAGVGFDLYCTLLRQSIARLRGEPAAKTIRASVHLDFLTVGEPHQLAEGHAPKGFFEEPQESSQTLAAYLPAAYVTEVRLRIDTYRRFALAETIEAVRELMASLKDRFGPPPDEVVALAALHEIRVTAESLGLVSVQTQGDKLQCTRVGPKGPEPLLIGNRFPRLTLKEPLLRMKEILNFLNNRKTSA